MKKEIKMTEDKKLLLEDEGLLFEDAKPIEQPPKNNTVQSMGKPVKPAPNPLINTTQTPTMSQNTSNELIFCEVLKQISSERLGTLELTEEQKQILYEDFKEDEVLIRPDGLIYLPWSFYANRFTKVWGLQWQIIPAEQPKTTLSNGMPTMICGFWLFVKGVAIAYAIGEHQERRKMSMSYSDTFESVMSNAILRFGKRIGMALKMWDREFVEQWKAKYAITYIDERSRETLWRKLTPEEIKEKEQKFLSSIHALKVPDNIYRKILKEVAGAEHAKEVPHAKRREVYLKLLEIANKEKEKEKDKSEEVKGEENVD